MISRSATRTKWRAKKHHAKEKGVEFNLPFDHYISLMLEAGITEEQIGWGAHKYCLGRYGDNGPYELGNCRFITNRENGIEGTDTRKLRGDGMPGGANLIGASHWNHKGMVVTPWGKFESLRKAATVGGALWGHNKIKNLIHEGAAGYFYQ